MQIPNSFISKLEKKTPIIYNSAPIWHQTVLQM